MKKANAYGFKGAFYPWESAYTGEDVCPGDSYIKYEQHVTADMIHTLKQYLYATGDWQFMSEQHGNYTAWDMVYETAKFWKSRVHRMSNGKYGINDVMGPDEYHWRVNNSAFTNAAAALNMLFACEASKRLGKNITEGGAFEEISNNIYIPFDDYDSYHPEFDGFNWHSDIVKQADTIMLNFPMGYDMVRQNILRDMDIYENITDPAGPAMTNSMFAVNWLSLEETNKASLSFNKQFQNIQPPFQIWSEIAGGGGAVNFLTGIGGFLQSILYGYLGLRYRESNFTLQPNLIPSKEVLSPYTVTGLNYQGCLFSVNVNKSYCTVCVKFLQAPVEEVAITLSDETHHILKTGDKIKWPTGKKITIKISWK